MTTPRAPVGLREEGRRFWREHVRQYEFSPAELKTLRNACRALDMIDRYEEAVDAEGFLLRAKGSMKQPVIPPEVDALLRWQVRFEQAVKALNLPTDDQGDASDGRPNQAREAAMARWGQRAAP
jgi:hypothetical protein